MQKNNKDQENFVQNSHLGQTQTPNRWTWNWHRFATLNVFWKQHVSVWIHPALSNQSQSPLKLWDVQGCPPQRHFSYSPVPFDLRISVKLEILSSNPQVLSDPLLVGACSYLLHKGNVWYLPTAKYYGVYTLQNNFLYVFNCALNSSKEMQSLSATSLK